jgi:uncharacterized protein YbdZ (MbtH family)
MNKFMSYSVNGRSSEDLEIVMKAAYKLGYIINPQEAYSIWDKHSDSYAAGWLFVDEDSAEWAVQSYYRQED